MSKKYLANLTVLDSEKECLADGEMYGVRRIAITKEQIKALVDGKYLRCDDGEYVTILRTE